MQWIGNQLGIPRLVGFDMGGTSTDVSLLDGELPRRFEHMIAGVRLQSPMLDVHTIAAGGGSILHFTDGRFAAGPDSAGADPGPACYGRDGPLTLTDVQVLLGHLRPDTLPAVFGQTALANRYRGRARSSPPSPCRSTRTPKPWRSHSSKLLSKRWRMRSARCRRVRVSMPPSSRCFVSAAPRVNTPAELREPRACAKSSCIHSPVFCRRSELA